MAQRVKRKSKPLSKAASEFRHAQRRAKERYGIELNKDRYMQLCTQVKDGKGQYLGKQSLRLSVWRIDAQDDSGKAVRPVVIYDKQRHRIVTFLPPDVTDAKGIPLEDDTSDNAA
jgi:hypothetical protein